MTSADGVRRRESTDALRPALVRILDPADATPVGFGLLASRTKIVTCAHVVATALREPQTLMDPPKRPVLLDFPLISPGEHRTAQVDAWVPMKPNGEGDVAGLLLQDPLPDGATPHVLAQDDAVGDHPVSVYGYQRQLKDAAGWVSGTIDGSATDEWLHIGISERIDNLWIQKGFSGSPVWDAATGRAIGLVNRAARPNTWYANAITGKTVLARWPALRAEYQQACPYREFRPFTKDDGAVFFGRNELAEKTVHVTARSEITVITGTSGAGKTSLLQAAVLPRLAADDKAAVVSIHPHLHETLWHALADAVLNRTHPRADNRPALRNALVHELSDLEPAARARTVLSRLGREHLILVADQFEILLSRAGAGKADQERAEQVASLLHRLATEASWSGDGTPAARVVVAVTDDLLQDVLELPGWRETAQVVRVGPLQGEQLRAAIEGPLHDGFARFQDGLLDRIMHDFEQQRLTLPDLQAMLTRMWEGQSDDGWLRAAHYNELNVPGGWQTARVELIWARLTRVERDAARRLLLHLVEPAGRDGTYRRHFAPQDDLDERDWQAAKMLAHEQNRLVVVSAGPHGTGMAELAHDSLLAHWPSARKHLHAHRDLVQWRSDLRRERATWAREDHAPGLLPRGAALRRHGKARHSYEPYMSGAEKRFIATAVGRQRRRIGRWLIWTFVGAAIVGLVVFLLLQEASSQRDAKDALKIAELSGDLAADDPVISQQLAVAAWRTQPKEPKAREALLRAAADRGRGILRTGRYGVSALALSPDSGTLVTGGNDNRIRFWGLTGRRTTGPQPSYDQSSPNVLAVSPDGRLLASGDDEGTVRLWDTADRVQVGKTLIVPWPSPARPIPDGRRYVLSLTFGTDNRSLVAVSSDGMLVRWDLRKAPAVSLYRDLGQPQGPVGLTRDGRQLAMADAHGGIQLWDTHTGRPKGTLPAAGRKRAQLLAFGPDGHRLAVVRGGNDNPRVELWDTTARQLSGHLLTRHSDIVTALAFSSDGAVVATGSRDHQVELLDADGTGLPIGETLTGHVGGIAGLAFSSDGRILASASDDGTVRLWDPLVLRPRGAPMDDGTGQLLSAAFSPNGRVLASTGASTSVHLWDPRTGRASHPPLTGRMGKNFSVTFSRDGSTLAATGDVGPAWLWDTRSWQPTGPPLEGAIGAVAFSPDGKLLATGDINLNQFDVQGNVRLYDTVTHNRLPPLLPAQRPDGGTYSRGHRGSVHALVFSPDGKFLASGAGFGEIQLWDVARRRAVGKPMTDHSGDVTSLAFSPDGRTLASGATDGTVRLWDTQTRRQTGKPLTGHTTAVNAVVFNPKGGFLASGGNDGRVRLWDVGTGHQIGGPLLSEGGVAVHALAFNSKGTLLAGGGARLRLWNVSALTDPAQTICARYHEPLPRNTWRDKLPDVTYRTGCTYAE
ncbi:trypsin-like peptidase domain-containing protein [Streptomyces sp. NPDC006465]|uniref:nSTAND1 domain-containing NTPase n=1 Tax=Streptomyces sp. NPDC006465 TaxID=3157174 RepID=UPI0033A75311